MIAAGSPGVRRSSAKTKMATTAMTGIVARRRLAMYASMQRDPPLTPRSGLSAARGEREAIAVTALLARLRERARSGYLPVFEMFQNTDAGATTTPSTLLRAAPG